MNTRKPERHSIPVTDGVLAVHRWAAREAGHPAGHPIVLAAHGITGNGLSWATVADALPGFEVLAPDLRGRAGSRALPGPWGLARHAEDLIGVLDHLGISEPVLLAGHSMGAFVACLAAVAHPERFAKVVLVDGGLAFPAPAGVDVDTVLDAVLGPAISRLSMEFPSGDAYHEFWRGHPSFGEIWTERTIAYVDYDLVGEPPHLRSSCVPEAIRTDGAEVYGSPEVHGAIHRIEVPTTLLWAQRGMLNQPAGFYSTDTIAALPDRAHAEFVPDVNHYSIVLGEAGAKAVAAAIAR
jgi:pimeloyl-ACP methyl ester carboxylesterase